MYATPPPTQLSPLAQSKQAPLPLTAPESPTPSIHPDPDLAAKIHPVFAFFSHRLTTLQKSQSLFSAHKSAAEAAKSEAKSEGLGRLLELAAEHSAMVIVDMEVLRDALSWDDGEALGDGMEDEDVENLVDEADLALRKMVVEYEKELFKLMWELDEEAFRKTVEEREKKEEVSVRVEEWVSDVAKETLEVSSPLPDQ